MLYTLTFNHMGENVYEYNNQNFMPFNIERNTGIPGKGARPGSMVDLGYEDAIVWIRTETDSIGVVDTVKIDSMNFGFGVHLTDSIFYVAHGADQQKFEFEGDDDAFIFIDGKLVLDIGGLHPPMYDYFWLGTVARELGWQDSTWHRYDFFVVERQCCASTVRLTLNKPCNAKVER